MKRTVVILGASRGLGDELRKAYVQNGWYVVGIASSFTDSETATGRSICCDLGAVESSQRCADLIDELDGIDRFFWVAGNMLRGPFHGNPSSDVHALIDVNLRNPLTIVQTAWRRQLESPTGGRMVVVSSTASRTPKAGESIYGATKAAQSHLTRAMAQENNNPLLSVGLIIPGGMKTGLWDGIEQPDIDSFSDPRRVAEIIFNATETADSKYFEVDIPRGTV